MFKESFQVMGPLKHSLFATIGESFYFQELNEQDSEQMDKKWGKTIENQSYFYPEDSNSKRPKSINNMSKVVNNKYSQRVRRLVCVGGTISASSSLARTAASWIIASGQIRRERKV
jgi:hypothetical protein